MTVNKLNLFTRRLVNLITFVECSRSAVLERTIADHVGSDLELG
jgi:hypothetical protein